jgi:hypothetical protein
MSEQDIEKLLNSGSTPNVRKAAKSIAKLGIGRLAPELQERLVEILPNSKLWETQVEIIKTLGLLNYKPSLIQIEEICQANKDQDMVTFAAATAYVRLKRENLEDVEPVFYLLNKGGYAVTCGALDALGYDRMMPANEDINQLISQCFDLRSPNPRGLSDPRYGLAAACAGWSKQLVEPFLLHCIKTGDYPVKHVAENSLKGKYVKLR